MYSTGYGYSNSSRLIETGPQVAGAEAGGTDCADTIPAKAMLISDNRILLAGAPDEQREFLMIPP